MQVNQISILDYGLGNIFSINECLKKAGYATKLISKREEIESAEFLILPGVGAFGVAMNYLKQNHLVMPLLQHVATGKPLVGICLGMQLLFESSEEHGYVAGLGLIKGHVKKFQPLENSPMRIPHIGWNKVNIPNNEDQQYLSFLKKEEPYFYFVHSYHANPENPNNLLLTSEYAGLNFCAAVKHQNIVGFQFHPENSAQLGQLLIKNIPTLF